MWPRFVITCPIVALTANALAEDRYAALAAGADTFVTKPVTVEKLLSALVAAMRTSAQADPGGAGSTARPRPVEASG